MRKSSDICYEPPIVEAIPDENSKDYHCGWFLTWFRMIVFESSRSQIKEYLQGHFDLQNCSTIEKESLYQRALVYTQMWKARWNIFFEKLWNHPTIMSLIDEAIPQSTKVIGHPNGFTFIIETIAENIFKKVFHGKHTLPAVKIHSYVGSTEIISLREDIYVLSKTGSTVLYSFINNYFNCFKI